MQLDLHELDRTRLQDKRKDRKALVIAAAIAAAVFLLCMSVRYNAYYYQDKFMGFTYFKSLFLSLRLMISRLLHTSLYKEGAEAAIEAVGGSIIYLGALARLKLTLMAFVAGAALCISGAIFQTAYNNPMASPNIIGATAGVGLGNILVVVIYSYAAYEEVLVRYRFCYGFTAVCVLTTLLLGRLAGDKRKNYSIMEMLMVGSIVSQMMSVIRMYCMYGVLDEEELLIFENIQMGTDLDLSPISMFLFFSVMLVSILPVLYLRYRLNVLGMDRTETTTIGVNVAPYRLIAQICGALMVTCAMIHCGEVGMISMVIPYMARQWVGSNFSRVCLVSGLLGASIMMITRLVSESFYILDNPIPATFLVSMILTPLFLIILAKQGGRGGLHMR